MLQEQKKEPSRGCLWLELKKHSGSSPFRFGALLFCSCEGGYAPMFEETFGLFSCAVLMSPFTAGAKPVFWWWSFPENAWSGFSDRYLCGVCPLELVRLSVS